MSRITRFAFLIALVLFPSLLSAQNVASMTGLVTDPSGAILPGVGITLENTKTGVSYNAKTDQQGVYRFVNIAPGPGYKASYALDGFSSYSVSDLYLEVSTTRTQNVTLQVGSVSNQIEVSGGSSNVTLNTVDATIGNNFDVKMVNDLPVQSRSTPQILFNLQPGVTAGAVTGARADQNTVTLDGLDVNDIAAGQDSVDGAGTTTFPIIGGAPVDAIQEFRGVTAGQRSNGGPGGGGQFQMVTKSGTNDFHGNLNEYHRNTVTTANDWFLNNAGVARPSLIRNQFGGNIGGPIIKDKLFFFFNFYDQRIAQSSNVQRLVPLDSYRNGNVSYIKSGCPASSRQNSNPGCIGTLTPDQVKAMDPAGIGVSPEIQGVFDQRYPRANDLSGGDGVNTGLFRFTAPIPDNSVNYVGRIDYNLTSHQSIWGRFIINRQDRTYSNVQFAGDPTTHPFTDRSYAYVIGHTWQIGENKVNSFQYGDNIAKLAFPTTFNPVGINEYTFGYQSTGSLLAGPYTDQSSQARRVPNPQFSDIFNWTIGRHQLMFGGSFKFPKTNSLLVGDFNTARLGLGGNLSQLNASLRPGDIGSSSQALTTFDSAFALALGRVGEIDSNYNYNVDGSVRPQGNGAVRAYRFYQTEAYFGDNWRITPNLTLDYGVRYQYYSVPFEAQGLQGVQNASFDDYFAARMAQSAAGASGNTAVPLLSYQLGGKANNGPDLYSPNYKDLAPHFGFTYSPSWDKHTVFNGGAGIIFDRTVINAVNFVQDQSSYLFQNSASTLYGAGGVANALRNDPRIGANLSIPAPPTAPVITKPLTPFVDTDGTPFGLATNQFNTAVDPHLKDPYSITYTFGMQHEFPQNFILKMNYVGRLGRRLIAQADASQLLDFPDRQSGQMMSAAFANMTQQLRGGADYSTIQAQPWFENVVTPGLGESYGYASNTALLADTIGSYIQLGDMADVVQILSSPGVFQDGPVIAPNIGLAAQFAGNTFITNKGSSNYNGFLVTLTKNTSHGLQFDVNYTWAHSIDNVSVVANTIASSQGSGFICDARNNRVCRGNSDFDISQVINSNFLYDLPFGRNRTYGTTIPFWLDELIGGWQISGIPQWRSGLAFSSHSSAFVM